MNEDPTLPIGAESVARATPPPRAANWGGFTLLARVGSGGFGEVYRAWDPSLQREIALKLLLPGAIQTNGDSRDSAEYESTLREARALASVRHPNIVSIYGVDQHDGRVGFWTDFVKGKTLSAIIGDHGPYGYREAALIGLDVTRALSAVHRAGLLHCDIKPENVMREEGGRILLMDFGLSSLPQRSSHIAGTPNYMAPELLTGAAPSVASDLHAVGVLLYFLVTGAHPVKLSGLSLEEAAEASKHRTPLVDLRSDLPDSFIRVVNRAIDFDPARRYTSAGQMAEALADCLGIAAATPPSTPNPGWAPPPPISAVPTPPAYVAVPVETKKEKKERTPLQKLGMVLIGVAFLVKACSGPSDHRKDVGQSVASKAIADAMDAKAAKGPGADSDDGYMKAEGLLLKSYKASNVTEAASEFKDILDDDPKNALAEAGLGTAYWLEYRTTQDPTLLEMAQVETNKAINLDANTAPAYVTLANIAAMQGNNALATQKAEKAISLDQTNAQAQLAMSNVYGAQHRDDDALAAIQKSIDLAPDDWRGPMALGRFYLRAGKLQEAASQFQRSASLTPDNAQAYYNLGVVEMRMNKLDEARGNIAKAVELEPDAASYQVLSWLYITEGKYADAVDAAQKATELAPTSYSAWANLGTAYIQTSESLPKAESAYRKAAALAEPNRVKNPKDAELLASMAYYNLRGGDPIRSDIMLRQALALSNGDPKVEYVAGEIYELRGERADAIESIAKSIGPGYSMAEMERDPDLVNLRKDPVFQARLKAVQLQAAGKTK